MNKHQDIKNFFFQSKVRRQSEKYLKEFWLDKEEIKNYWTPIKNSIFSSSFKRLPDLIYNEGFNIISQRGGTVFIEDEYRMLQKCMRTSGDKFFVMIENKLIRQQEEGDLPHLSFIFPVETTWMELNNGNVNYPDISYDLLWIMNKEFFIFGDSGKWGKYSASDFDPPLDIIGFKPELAPVFRCHFKQSIEE